MKIKPKAVKVREVFESYVDNGDDGVFAYEENLLFVLLISVSLFTIRSNPRLLYIQF